MDINKYLDRFPVGEGYNNIIRQTIRYGATCSLKELGKYIEEGSVRFQGNGIGEAVEVLREILIARRQEEE